MMKENFHSRRAGLTTCALAFAVSLADVGCSSAPEVHGNTAGQSLTSGSAIVGYANKCLDDNGAGTGNGNKIQLWDCNGSDAQRWSRVGKAIVGPGDKCLDIQWSNQANGTPVQLWDCNGTDAQSWSFNGSTIVSTQGFCLDVSGYGSANGTQLQIWTCTGGANQQWSTSQSPGTPPPPPPPPGNSGQWQEGSLNGMTYALLLPDAYDSSQHYPLMLFLHQLQNDGQIPQQIDPWFNISEFRSRFPAIVVAPRCPSSGADNNWGGVSTQSQGCGDSAVAIVQSLMGAYPVDARRVYVTGDSMGGIGSWDLIIRQQNLFAATLIVAGATYDHDLNQAAAQLRNTPIWAVHGSNDGQVPLDWDRNMYQLMQNQGGLMKYTEMQGFGHDVWDTVYPDLSYMQWLFAQTK